MALRTLALQHALLDFSKQGVALRIIKKNSFSE